MRDLIYILHLLLKVTDTVIEQLRIQYFYFLEYVLIYTPNSWVTLFKQKGNEMKTQREGEKNRNFGGEGKGGKKYWN